MSNQEMWVDSKPAPLLAVHELSVRFQSDEGRHTVLDGVSLTIEPGQTVGLVGESGCGKSVTALAIMGLLPRPIGQVSGGSIHLQGDDLLTMSPSERYQMRGNRIAMIFQEPMTALNPVQTIGAQLCEVYALHRQDYTRQQQREAAIEMLRQVGIPEPTQRMQSYPHQLSGGMRQRVMIAMALACEPDLLICDEPTTALDVTIQAQILDLMRQLQRQRGMALLFITHDLGVVAEMCDQVVVMYAGRVVEQCDVFSLFESPRHPYSRGLLRAMPRLDDEPKTPLPTIPGQVPALGDMPPGCRFANRCAYQSERCHRASPADEQVDSGHRVACHHWRNLLAEGAAHE